MEYSIQELVGNVSGANVNRMIPILIGKSKTIYKEDLNFLDSDKTQLQLTNINNSLIDESTLSVNIKSWNLKTSKFSISFTPNTANEVNLSVTLTERLSNLSLFVIVDNSDNILFSSNIDKFIYSGSDLIKIKLSTTLSSSGTLYCYIICLETKNVIGSFNSLSNILTINTDFLFKTNSFNTISETSYLTYVGSSRVYSVQYFDKITQDIIDGQKNLGIKAGLILNQSAVVISYPNETYIGQLIEDLDKLEVGYYIVPVDVSSIGTLASYTKQDNNKFYMLITSDSSLLGIAESKKLGSNLSYTL